MVLLDQGRSNNSASSSEHLLEGVVQQQQQQQRLQRRTFYDAKFGLDGRCSDQTR